MFFQHAKTAQVRSIQKHDEEFDVAGEGDRVGLALKNVEVEDLDRGAVLTNDPAIKTSTKLTGDRHRWLSIGKHPSKQAWSCTLDIGHNS